MKQAKTGLVLGKFMPLHSGHLALIDFGLKYCDKLIVLVCYSDNERINGDIRVSWLKQVAKDNTRLHIEQLHYDEANLPNTSVSSREVSKLWAGKIAELFPHLDILFSSEPYGDYLAEFLKIEHKSFDIERRQVKIAASSIIKDPFSNWEFIAAAAKPYFVKKISLLGSESTGKSTLAEQLSREFNTVFVPEMARHVIEKTKEVVYDDLLKIATLHAQTILEKSKLANRLLICDTDVNITASYSEYLFKKPLIVPDWIREANNADLYIFLEADCPFVQDGTRLSEEERNDLSEQHKKYLDSTGITYYSIGGNWDDRFQQARDLIEKHLFGKEVA